MHKHKILYIHEERETIGGGTTSLLHLFKSLDRKRFEPIILCPGTWGLRSEIEKLDIRVVPTWLPPWTKGKSIPFVIPATWKLAQFLKREKICSIFHCGIRNIPYGFFATKFVPIPSLCHISRGSVVKRWHLPVYFAHSPNLYFVPSMHDRPIAENAGIDKRRLTVIHHGLNMAEHQETTNKNEARKALGISPDIPVILSLGRFVAYKSYEYVIQALQTIKKTLPNIKYIIVGEKPRSTAGKSSREYYDFLQSMVDRLSLRDHVNFVGFKYGKGKNLYLSAMDAFVHPAIEEDFGIVMLEAMAMRRPVIANDRGGGSEIVMDGKTGLLIPSQDTLAISSAVMELLLDPEKSRIMGNEGRKRVETHFTSERQAREHEKLYEMLLRCCNHDHDGNQ